MDKDITRVLDAVGDGMETSDQIGDVLGIGLHAASHWLTELRKMGLIRVVDGDKRRQGSRGPWMSVYVLAE